MCDNCLKVYEEVAKNAKSFAGQPVDFGFFDLFKNQHALLKEEDVPLILIYSRNSRNYQKINVEEKENLESIINRELEAGERDEL